MDFSIFPAPATLMVGIDAGICEQEHKLDGVECGEQRALSCSPRGPLGR